MPQATLVGFPHVKLFGLLVSSALEIGLADCRHNGRDNRLRDVVMKGRMGGVIQVIVPAPNLHNRRCVDQPSREAGASSRGAHTPFQHIARAKLAADLPRIVGCTSSGKPGPTRNQDHLAQLRQLGRHIFGDAFAENIQIGGTGQVGEGQDDDRWSATEQARQCGAIVRLIYLGEQLTSHMRVFLIFVATQFPNTITVMPTRCPG